LPIQQIFVLPVAVCAPGDGYLVEVYRQPAVFVKEVIVADAILARGRESEPE
jgi:hypothetical protein